MLHDIEAYRMREVHNPSRAAIAGLPERVGLTQERVTLAFLDTSSLEEANAFVSDYLTHIRENIDQEHISDAVALTKRHLIDQMYFAYAPVELKENHPANLRAIQNREKSRRFIVEAMIELLGDTSPGGLDESIPSNREYAAIRDSILAEKSPRLSA